MRVGRVFDGGARRRVAVLAAVVMLAVAPSARSALAAVTDETAGAAFDARLMEARVLLDRSRFAAAESAARVLLPEAEARFGPRAPRTSDVLDVLVGSLWRNGFAPSAETRALAERALAQRDTSREGADSSAIATLANAAQVRTQNGEPEAARPLVDRAIELRRRWPGPDSLLLAWTLNDRAACAMASGDLDAARADFRRVVEIREHGLPRNATLTGWAYSNLAYAEQNAGDLVAARDGFRHALLVFETGNAPANDRAHALKNLAHVEAALGDTARARRLFEHALAIRRRVNGPESPEVANSLNDLAALLLATGHPREARPLAERALEIRTRVYGPEHPETATSLLTVGSLELASGDAIAARAPIERAVAIRARVFGTDAPNTARAEDRLVEALVAGGRADTACRVARHALASKQARLGERHPDLAPTWLGYAVALRAAGREAEAFDAALWAETIARDHLLASLAALPEEQAMAYESARVSGLDLALALTTPAAPSRASRAWDAVVRSRACVMDAMSLRLREQGPVTDRRSRARHERERIARRRLARLIMNAPTSPDSAWRDGMARAQTECEAAEQDLAAHDEVTRAERARLAAGLDAVGAAQPRGSALVGYVRFTDPGTRTAGPRYLAFVRVPGAPVRVVELGAAAPIDSATRRWRAAVSRGDEPAARRVGDRLRSLVWDPLRVARGDARLVLMVADGALVGVDPYALPDPDGGYVIERGPTLQWLGAERDLVVPPGPATDDRLVAFGGMTFPPGEAPNASLPRLPQSRLEVRDIAAVWDSTLGRTGRRFPAQVVTGPAATADSFRVLAGTASVLHVATHAIRIESAGGAARADAVIEHGRLGPMFAAGLAFTPAGRSDAGWILSAAEAAMLDLRRTRWLVLSGCDTGTGPVAGREGVLGLRRAFAMAGARTQFVTVWGVRDDVCRSWMRALYHARFVERRSTAEATRIASLRVLARRRALGLSTSPDGWAGFVAVGDWR